MQQQDLVYLSDNKDTNLFYTVYKDVYDKMKDEEIFQDNVLHFKFQPQKNTRKLKKKNLKVKPIVYLLKDKNYVFTIFEDIYNKMGDNEKFGKKTDNRRLRNLKKNTLKLISKTQAQQILKKPIVYLIDKKDKSFFYTVFKDVYDKMQNNEKFGEKVILHYNSEPYINSTTKRLFKKDLQVISKTDADIILEKNVKQTDQNVFKTLEENAKSQGKRSIKERNQQHRVNQDNKQDNKQEKTPVKIKMQGKRILRERPNTIIASKSNNNLKKKLNKTKIIAPVRPSSTTPVVSLSTNSSHDDVDDPNNVTGPFYRRKLYGINRYEIDTLLGFTKRNMKQALLSISNKLENSKTDKPILLTLKGELEELKQIVEQTKGKIDQMLKKLPQNSSHISQKQYNRRKNLVTNQIKQTDKHLAKASLEESKQDLNQIRNS